MDLRADQSYSFVVFSPILFAIAFLNFKEGRSTPYFQILSFLNVYNPNFFIHSFIQIHKRCLKNKLIMLSFAKNDM